MKYFLSALLLAVATLVPVATYAQVPDSQSAKNKEHAEQRTREIEAARSDIADLSKFEADHEYLPKAIWKRNYSADEKTAQVIAGHPKYVH